MTRKPLLLTAALVAATFAFSASGALAVAVENPGMHAVTGENTLTMAHGYLPRTMAPNLLEITGLKCNHTTEMTTSSTGAFDLHSVDLSGHMGSVGPCNEANDCDDAGWNGQIEESHDGTDWEYGVHLTFCLVGTSSWFFDGIQYSIECQLAASGASIHCGGTHDNEGPDTAESEAHLFAIITQLAPGIPIEFAVEGELFIDPPIELMHE